MNLLYIFYVFDSKQAVIFCGNLVNWMNGRIRIANKWIATTKNFEIISFFVMKTLNKSKRHDIKRHFTWYSWNWNSYLWIGFNFCSLLKTNKQTLRMAIQIYFHVIFSLKNTHKLEEDNKNKYHGSQTSPAKWRNNWNFKVFAPHSFNGGASAAQKHKRNAKHC